MISIRYSIKARMECMALALLIAAQPPNGSKMTSSCWPLRLDGGEGGVVVFTRSVRTLRTSCSDICDPALGMWKILGWVGSSPSEWM